MMLTVWVRQNVPPIAMLVMHKDVYVHTSPRMAKTDPERSMALLEQTRLI